jgi:hypothetical protein
MKTKLYIKLASVALIAMTGFSSCLKDDAHYVDFAGATPLIELPSAANVGGSGGLFQSQALDNAASVPVNLAINLASPHTLSSDITVKVSVDEAALASYNSANGNKYVLLPANYYTSTLSAVIKANTNLSNIVINVNSTLIDPAKTNYVLPLTITDGGGQKISNYKTVLLNIQAKNIYDGSYSLKGYVYRNFGDGTNDASLGGYFKGLTQNLATIDGTSVTLTPVWKTGVGAAGVVGTSIKVNPTTNKVTVSSTGNATLGNNPAYDNRYDPATKTFYISYKWGASPNDRSQIDTLVYTGSR